MPWLLVVSVICACWFYIEALKGGIRPRHWALMGFLLGPLAWPLMAVEKRLWWRRVCGFSGIIMRA